MLTLQNIIDEYDEQKEIYIVGSGPSLRVFPLEFFKDKFTIGLNNVWKILPTTLSITIHPDCIPIDPALWAGTKWITKIKKSEDSWSIHEKNNNHKKWYFFHNSADLSTLHHSPPNQLYCGRGIQTAALHLAAILASVGGCKWVYMAGVDCGSLGGDHHCNLSHIQTHNIPILSVYKEYYYFAVKCREILEKRYNVHFLTLSSLFGVKETQEEDYIHQRSLKGLKAFPDPIDIETNPRTTDLVSSYL